MALRLGWLGWVLGAPAGPIPPARANPMILNKIEEAERLKKFDFQNLIFWGSLAAHQPRLLALQSYIRII